MHDNYHMPMHPFGFAVSALSEDEKRDLEFVQFLLSVAENVGYQQHDRASRLLLHCEWISSTGCTSVQRVVFQFALALRERIEKESEKSIKTAKGFKQNDVMDQELEPFIAYLLQGTSFLASNPIRRNPSHNRKCCIGA